MERLQKYLANNDVASRRKCEQLIKDGLVKVNGKIATIGTLINPDVDVVEYDGKIIEKKDKLFYFVINKPLGVVTSKSDQFNRQDISTLTKDLEKKYNIILKPVGRLDMFTTGLLILTNDGDLINKLTHPSFEIEKTYLVTLNKKISKEQINALKNGVEIDNNGVMYLTKPAKVKVLNDTKIAITIHEGKNRQIRKMVNAVGLSVKALHRSKLDTITISNLKPGNIRPLTDSEIKNLKK